MGEGQGCEEEVIEKAPASLRRISLWNMPEREVKALGESEK